MRREVRRRMRRRLDREGNAGTEMGKGDVEEEGTKREIELEEV